MKYKPAIKAYEIAQKTAIQPRELERLALAKTTYKLTSAKENFELGKSGYSKYADALKYNQKLWTLIQSNIADNPKRIRFSKGVKSVPDEFASGGITSIPIELQFDMYLWIKFICSFI